MCLIIKASHLQNQFIDKTRIYHLVEFGSIQIIDLSIFPGCFNQSVTFILARRSSFATHYMHLELIIHFNNHLPNS